jgi:hypothetical protein
MRKRKSTSMFKITKTLLLGLVAATAAFAQAGPFAVPAPNPFPGLSAGFDWGSYVVNQVQIFVTQFGGLFVQEALWGLAVIYVGMILWTWIQWGMAKISHIAGHSHTPWMPLPQIAMLSFKCLLLAFILNHYLVNFPGVGFSFHSWPMAVAQHMTMQLDNGPGSPKDQLVQLLLTPTAMIDKPINPLDVIGSLVYLNVLGMMGFLSFIMFVLGGMSFVLSGVFTVIGPYFVALWMLGGRPAGWAWNWMQVMIALASYRVFASAIEFVIGNMWIYFFSTYIGLNTSIANWVAMFAICIGLTLFSFITMAIIPLMAAQIFNGAGAIAQAGVSAVTSAAGTIAKML